MPLAIVLGGTGAIGRATATRLVAAGWEVVVTGRDPGSFPPALGAAGVRFAAADRGDATALRAVCADGADVLVDCACFTAADAEQLVPFARAAGSTVLVSSKAVYVDAAGRHSNSDDPPRFDGPIPETHPTLPPGGGDPMTREGYGRNKVAAERVLLESGAPVTVMRPSKVHGPGARRPREWVFVKRVLDRRPVVVLARDGSDVDHTTAAANVAALVETVAACPGARVLNAADPDAPSALEIARTVARLLAYDWHEVLLEGAPEGPVGAHPWATAHPIVLDTSAAAALGYRPAGDYATTVAQEVEWLVAPAGEAGDGEWREPADDPFFVQYLDYGAEDAYLAARARERPGRG